MRKIVFLVSLLFISYSSYSQRDLVEQEKRLKFGFNLGVNQSNVFTKHDLNEEVSLENNIGFRLGVLADYKINKFMSISPKAELSFNNSYVNFENTDNSRYEVLPLSLEFMPHFVFTKEGQHLNPYLLIGPNFRLPLNNNSSDPSVYSSSYDIAIDVGIGLEKPLNYFNLGAELRYSYGLMNVNQNPMIQSIYFHNVALVLSFL
ncbi:outer membrane beta-barrel protein [Brumimicrobium aurantiacum]|uniref:outer membrane beta-barrel protein n=1 Tax=Brumimicrobium aurantiacum TaxID=1737063 RepID=UPI0014037FD9|nr:outer membrane beta-barrel protein [Brumimicrobium aurantiacum]